MIKDCVILFLICTFLGLLICQFISSHKKVCYDKDFIIILGCKVKKDGTPSTTLKKRIDNAVDFSKKQLAYNNKKIIFISSGGKKKIKRISEAEAIKNCLINLGIDSNSIIIEDKSSTTLENIIFSKRIVDKINPSAKVLISTTNYHVFRACAIATKKKLNVEGIGSKIDWYYFPQSVLREFLCIIFSFFY